MIKVCMFDMGGVTDIASSDEMEKNLLRYFGVKEYDNFRSITPLYAPLARDFGAGIIKEETFWKEFEKITKIKVPNEKNLYTKFFFPVRSKEVLNIINKLKENGIRVVAASNVEEPQRIWHEKNNDYDIFDYAYTSDLMHVYKPEREFFKIILKSENIKASEAFFTDDRLENIDSAKKLGIETFHFTTPSFLKEKLKSLNLIY